MTAVRFFAGAFTVADGLVFASASAEGGAVLTGADAEYAAVEGYLARKWKASGTWPLPEAPALFAAGAGLEFAAAACSRPPAVDGEGAGICLLRSC